MPIVQQFKTVGDFWNGMVIPDCDAYRRDVADLRLALHSATSLFHMHDWVFHAHESSIVAIFTHQKNNSVLSVSKASNFANSLQQSNANFGLIRDIANAGKHFKLDSPSGVPNSPSHSAKTRTQSTGYGQGGYGRGPYGGSPRVMLEVGTGSDIEYLTICNDVFSMWQSLIAQYSWL